MIHRKVLITTVASILTVGIVSGAVALNSKPQSAGANDSPSLTKNNIIRMDPPPQVQTSNDTQAQENTVTNQTNANPTPQDNSTNTPAPQAQPTPAGPVDPSTTEHIVIDLNTPITNGNTVVKSTQALGN